jgi:hypothetical protein
VQGLLLLYYDACFFVGLNYYSITYNLIWKEYIVNLDERFFF